MENGDDHQSEISRMGLLLDKIDSRVDEILITVRKLASKGTPTQLEAFSAVPLDGTGGNSYSGTTSEILPEWAFRTLAAVKKLCRRGIFPTATAVATITKKRRNTESNRLVFLASVGVLQRKRNGRNVLYYPTR